MLTNNIDRLQEVAEGLGDLNDKVTYVGGSVVELYPSEEAADSRPTMDVDCVVEYFSFKEKEEFEELLRRRHFQEDMDGEVICRWVYGKHIVDIMPTDEKFLQFTNRWYKPGVENRQPYQLPNGRIIHIMSPVYFVATKLEALDGRGGDDLRGSKDFEDIVYILNYCPEFLERCKNEKNTTLKDFIIEQFRILSQRSNIQEEIECTLPYGEEDRGDLILEIIQNLSSI